MTLIPDQTIKPSQKYFLLSAQLISHTKNVERAVTMSQQDMVSKKEQQGAKLQEINHKLASVQQVGLAAIYQTSRGLGIFRWDPAFYTEKYLC